VLNVSCDGDPCLRSTPRMASHMLIDPIGKTLEVHTLGDDRRWRGVRADEGDARVRVEPVAAIELDLAERWVR